MMGAVGEDDLPSALIVILDMSPRGWERSVQAGGPSAVDAAESLLTFVRAFFLLNGGNSVIVIATHPRGSEYLYQSPVHAGPSAQVVGALEMDSFDHSLHTAIVALAQRLQAAAADAADGGGDAATRRSGWSGWRAIGASWCPRLPHHGQAADIVSDLHSWTRYDYAAVQTVLESFVV